MADQQATNPQALYVGTPIAPALRFEDASSTGHVTSEEGDGYAGHGPKGTPPPGTAFTLEPELVALSGTPTEAGSWTVELCKGEGTYGPVFFDMVFNVAGPQIITAPVPVFNDEDYTVTVPEAEAVSYSVDGEPAEPGAVLTFDGGTSVTVDATAAAGYSLEGESTWSHTFPGLNVDALLTEDPEAVAVRDALAPRVLTHTAADTSTDATELASAHVGVVLEYVNGYTRGRGFHGMIPERDLQAVIVAAASRLFTNPEQVGSFTMGDYSERPAVLAGWTMAEMGVLRRHRRTYR